MSEECDVLSAHGGGTRWKETAHEPKCSVGHRAEGGTFRGRPRATSREPTADERPRPPRTQGPEGVLEPPWVPGLSSAVGRKGFSRAALSFQRPAAGLGGKGTPVWVSQFREGSGGLQERPALTWSTCKHGESASVLEEVSRKTSGGKAGPRLHPSVRSLGGGRSPGTTGRRAFPGRGSGTCSSRSSFPCAVIGYRPQDGGRALPRSPRGWREGGQAA